MKNEGYKGNFFVPKFFSDTRFANHCNSVHNSFYFDYPVLIITLIETYDNLKNGNTRDREKSTQALNLSMKMKDPLFVLQFVGMCDIYSMYGERISILQKVDDLHMRN